MFRNWKFTVCLHNISGQRDRFNMYCDIQVVMADRLVLVIPHEAFYNEFCPCYISSGRAITETDLHLSAQVYQSGQESH